MRLKLRPLISLHYADVYVFADLAVLVMDINEGIKPQTAEVLQILKMNKTPFVVALNKIDKITGWKKLSDDLKTSVENQGERVKEDFLEKYYTLQGALQSYELETDLFYNITDFTKKIALVPCSAYTKEGIPELILVLSGLSEKFLTKRLELHSEPKGVMLEVKKELELTKHYLEDLIECAGYGIIGVDRKGKVFVWNKGAEDLFGEKANDVIGRDVSAVIPRYWREHKSNLIDKVLQGDVIRDVKAKRELSDGKFIDISLTLSPIKDSKGDIVGASAIVHKEDNQ